MALSTVSTIAITVSSTGHAESCCFLCRTTEAFTEAFTEEAKMHVAFDYGGEQSIIVCQFSPPRPATRQACSVLRFACDSPHATIIHEAQIGHPSYYRPLRSLIS